VNWRPRFAVSRLSYTRRPKLQYQAAVKVPGSFRPSAGNEHLYSYCNFAESPGETVPKSLRHSCRSELTRQGISLLPVFFHLASPRRRGAWTISSSRVFRDGWRMASEDPALRFPADSPAWPLSTTHRSDCHCRPRHRPERKGVTENRRRVPTGCTGFSSK
jgi:hypothetical protein